MFVEIIGVATAMKLRDTNNFDTVARESFIHMGMGAQRVCFHAYWEVNEQGPLSHVPASSEDALILFGSFYSYFIFIF